MVACILTYYYVTGGMRSSTTITSRKARNAVALDSISGGFNVRIMANRAETSGSEAVFRTIIVVVAQADGVEWSRMDILPESGEYYVYAEDKVRSAEDLTFEHFSDWLAELGLDVKARANELDELYQLIDDMRSNEIQTIDPNAIGMNHFRADHMYLGSAH
jgi:hypothetical protein